MPQIAEQIAISINDLSEKLGLTKEMLNTELIITNIGQWGSTISQNLGETLKAGMSGIIGLFGGIVTLVSLITVSIYLSIEQDIIFRFILDKIKNSRQKLTVQNLITDTRTEMGRWFGGQMILCVSIGVLSWTVLTILQVPYALPLAILAAIFEVIPIIGPTISAIPAILIVLATGTWLQKIGVPIGYILIQQLENQFLVPRIMADAVGMPKVVILLAALAGGQIYGPIGILLAIPLISLVNIGVSFYLKYFHKVDTIKTNK
jgi:predicted PurR-regulated permease PerM